MTGKTRFECEATLNLHSSRRVSGKKNRNSIMKNVIPYREQRFHKFSFSSKPNREGRNSFLDFLEVDTRKVEQSLGSLSRL